MVYHLSHIDLDGYFCQYLSTKKFKKIKYFNANYGNEVFKNIKKIFKEAKKDDKIIITDLNLTFKEAEYINNFYEKGFDITLYDHHISENNLENKFKWYFVDKSKSASKIFSEKENIQSTFTDAVNSYDIWTENDNLILGCLLSEFINKEPLFYFNEDKVLFFNAYFDFFEGKEFLEIETNENLFIKKYLNNYDNNISVKMNLSKKYMEDMPLIPIKQKYIFLFDLDREYFQYVSQYILKDNPNYIVVLISKNGRLSFRSKIEDVNYLSSFFRGGGHKNAAGGTLDKHNISNKEEGMEIFLEKID